MLPIAVLTVLLLLTTARLVMLFLSQDYEGIEFCNALIQASRIAKVVRLFLIKTTRSTLKMKKHVVDQHSHLNVFGKPKKARNTSFILRYGMALGCVATMMLKSKKYRLWLPELA